jgi:hypothetical protein
LIASGTFIVGMQNWTPIDAELYYLLINAGTWWNVTVLKISVKVTII